MRNDLLSRLKILLLETIPGWVQNHWVRLKARKNHRIPPPPPVAQAQRKRWKTILLITGLGGLASLLLLGVALSVWLSRTGVLNIDESRLAVITQYQHADNSLVFDRSGEKIGEFYSDYHIFVPYEKIPKDLINAILAVEDRRFFEHSGLDFRGIARAGFSLIVHRGYAQGGSTLTQQVVRNFLLTPEKSIERKLKEAALALELERRLSKKQILEIYLNALFLGQGAYGAGAAAERHFGKSLDQLELHELALIAGLFQSPSRYNPHKYPKLAKARQQRVLKAMLDAGFIDKKVYQASLKRPLEYRSLHSLNAAYAPYFIDAVQEQTEKILTTSLKGKGLRIYTTLDLALQKQVAEVNHNSGDIYRRAAQRLIGVKRQDPKLIEIAALTLDHETGAILAMQGGRDYAQSQFNRALKAKRSPGSSFKPIVYAQALLSGMKWSDTVYVAPVSVQDYRPKNYGHDFMTEVTLYNAFYRSINTPVIEIGQKIGVRNVLDLAKKMGIQTPLKNQAGTLLGGSELTLLDMASAYATIANYGQPVEPFMITKITDREGKVLYERPSAKPKLPRALPEAVAFEMIHAMQAVFRHGTASAFPQWAARAGGKTGTTDEAKDTWFAGFTRNLTTVVWVGTDENYAFQSSVAANTLALPLWDRMMQRAVALHPLKEPSFPVPQGVVLQRVHPLFGYKQDTGMEMPFLQGQEPTKSSSTLSIVRDTGSFRDYLDR